MQDPRLVSSIYICMQVVLIPNKYVFSMLNSHVCRIRHIIPKWNYLFEIWDIGSYTSPGAPSICPRSHGFFFARHVTFWQWTLAARHDCNFNIFCAAPSVILLACVTLGYSNIVLRHIFCFNLCMSPLLSINILTVTFNIFLF